LLAIALLTLVALVVTLFDKPQRFLAQVAVMTIDKILLLGLVDCVPSRTDVRTARQAYLGAALVSISPLVMVIAFHRVQD
jgi:uncharacterized membrane protein YqjE